MQSNNKKCTKCDKIKDILAYSRDRIKPDGLRPDCKKCVKTRASTFYKKNRDKIKDYSKNYYNDNKEKVAKRVELHYEKNKEKIIKRTSDYQKTHRKQASESAKRFYKKDYNLNKQKYKEKGRKSYLRNKKKHSESTRKYYVKNKDKIKEYSKNYAKQNSYKINAYSKKRKADKIHQTPKWLTKDHLKEMENFYKKAKEMSINGVKYEVDHIIPLRGKEVRGLHVPWNLQILTKQENNKKRNKVL